MSKKKVIVILFMLMVVIGIVVLWLLKKEEQKTVTLDTIKMFNGGVMPDYKLKENGTLLYLDGCFSEKKVTSTKEAVIALNAIKDLLGIQDANVDLRQSNIEEDELGLFLQFEQVYEGIYVYGSMVALWADYEGNTGFLRSDCSVIPENFVCVPSISLAEAQALVKEDVVKEQEGELCIYETENDVRLAWRFYIMNSNGEFEMIVDAENGNILYTCKTSCDAIEQKLQVTTMGLQGKSYPISVLKNTSGIYELHDKNRKIVIYNGNGGISKFNKITSASKTSWDLSAVTAMYHLSTIYDYYLSLTGRYSYNGGYFATTGNTVKAVINTGIYDNAYWSGNKSMILIGTGSNGGMFYPMSFAVAKDIVAHEFTHAVISDKTSLENVYYGPAGAINEGYADIFGCLIEGDWKIGEDITKKNSIRDIFIPFNTSNPSEVKGAFYQDYKTNTADYGGIHKNSTIISHIAYVLYQNGMSRNQLAKLWYRSLCFGYGRDTDFYDVRVNVLAAAKALNFSNAQITIINQAFDEANIKKETCQESSNASYKRLYERQGITQNQSLESELPPTEIIKEIILEWEDETLDLDLHLECLNEDGEKFLISYQNQEYRNENGEVVANLVCDYIKGEAKEVIQIWSRDITIVNCTVKVYGGVIEENSRIAVTLYEDGIKNEEWDEWNVF